MNEYNEFLESKIVKSDETGFDVKTTDLPDFLKPHQRDAIEWALKGGKRALFESFGLGKTVQQLIILNEIFKKEGGKYLIICPLGVRQEFKKDATNPNFGLNLEIEYVKTLQECKDSKNHILITNYERVRDGDIDPLFFNGVTLDEASVLRSFGSKTYQTFLNKFHGVKYKFVCTATPSPNKYKELIHYAGFLEAMDTGQALTRFFKRDSTQANNLTLHPHKEEEFWLWVSTWAIFVTKPSDLGYSDVGYDLPPLKIHYHKLPVDHTTAGEESNGQSKMFRDASLSLKDASREKRDSLGSRINKMSEIIKESPDDHFILWHDLESERHEIKKALPEALDVYGSQDLDLREQRTVDFSNGKFKYLATKPEISGQGCNFQKYCHKAIFLGIGYKFNSFIQAIHRVYRFLQENEVEIHIIYTESEQDILDALLKKWEQHEYLVKKMREIVAEYGLSHSKIEEKMKRSIGVERIETKGENYTAINNDCILETREMESDSIGLIHTSIPFSNHYEYTPSYNDFGHNVSNKEFFEQMDFLTPELLRILKPGRLAAIHVKDRILFGNATGTGMPTVDPFSDMTVMHFIRNGFNYIGRIIIVTDVVRENNQTYRLGWTEQTKDGSKMGVGCPEYVLLFRKSPTDTSRAYADEPVTKTKEEYTRAQWQIDAHAFWRSSGNRFIEVADLIEMNPSDFMKKFKKHSANSLYNYKEHVDIGKAMDERGKLPTTFMSVAPTSSHDLVWDDVNRMRTMNTTQSQKDLNQHICPLQFDIVERIINRYSNKGDIVLDPFGGLMTVPYMAVKMGRYGIGIELNHGYYLDGVSHLKQIEEQITTPTLFDLIESGV